MDSTAPLETKNYKFVGCFQVPEETPKLDIGNNMGYTDYLDFLTLEDVNAPVMHGIDCYRRPFVVVKFVVDYEDQKTQSHVIKRPMETFFQRYTNETGLWHGCGHANPLPITTCGGMTTFQKEEINKLLRGEVLTITEDYKPDEYYAPIGSTIRVDY